MKKLKYVLVAVLSSTLLVAQAIENQDPAEGESSIYNWPKAEIIDNYFLLEDELNQSLLILKDVHSKHLAKTG